MADRSPNPADPANTGPVRWYQYTAGPADAATRVARDWGWRYDARPDCRLGAGLPGAGEAPRAQD
jgi:hypothetical protein